VRILVVSPFPPRTDGLHGGARAIATRVAHLAQQHEVSLFFLRNDAGERASDDLVASCVHVVGVDRSPSEGTNLMDRGWRGLPLIASRAWQGLPVWAQAFESTRAREELGTLVRRFEPEIVQFEYHVTAALRDVAAGIPSVVTFHEPASRIAESTAGARRGIWRLLNVADRRAWSTFERRIVDTVEAVVVFSARDALQVAGHPRATVIPLSVPLQSPPAAEAGNGRSVVFVGNYGHHPNVDAARWLIDDIYPRVRAAVGDARLWIVGDGPRDALDSLRSRGSAEVTGRVPDASDWTRRATVFVAPLRLGGGIRVKVLEALAAGKAVVATPLAVAGLEGVGGAVSLADTGESLAERISELLASPEKRAKLEGRARAWAERHLSGEREARAYIELYESLLS
jgi:glycosyltransferase involved in cell wall biosynthesis